MRKMTSLKIQISALAIACAACAQLPPVPHHTQYGVHADVNPPGFYGVDNETRERKYRQFDSAEMKGGQCLTNADYRAFQEYYKQVKEIARRRCK